MSNITLGDIQTAIVFIATFITSTSILVKHFSKIAEKKLIPVLDKIDNVEKRMNEKLDQYETKIDERIDIIETQIKNTHIATLKSFLVNCIADLENNKKLDEAKLERFFDAYDEYIASGGNSHIKHRVEKLKKEGRI